MFKGDTQEKNHSFSVDIESFCSEFRAFLFNHRSLLHHPVKNLLRFQLVFNKKGAAIRD